MSEESDKLEAEATPRSGVMRSTTRAVVILLVMVIGVGGFIFLKNNGPEAVKEAPPKVIPVVRVITAESAPYQHFVETQGRVEPARVTQAAAEVMGRVVDVSDKFKSGGVFKEKEVMLEIDSADYIAAVASAKATLADAQLLLEQEQARAEQARRDWAKLGRGTPSDLVLRVPQIESAKARVTAADAAVKKAVRDLERTKLRAPYDCRVEKTYTDLGSYITPGVRLADLYSRANFEVRMPVTLQELGYLKQGNEGVIGSDVSIVADVAGSALEWNGKIIRSEGMVDRSTMTMHVVMAVAPNKESERYAYPPAGMVVKSKITGRQVTGVTEIPRSAVREDNTVLTLTAESKLKIVPVQLARTMETTVLVSSGLPDGTRVITSPIEMAVNGMELEVQSADNEKEKTP